MKKYYLNKRYRIFLSIISALPLILATLFLVPLYFSEGDTMWLYFILFVLAVTGMSFAGLFFSIYIGISNAGIEYSLYTRKIKAKWSDVEGIFNSAWQEGIIVNKPSGISPKTFVSLSWFANNWRDSDLGQQIKQLRRTSSKKKNPRKSVKSVAKTLGAL